MGHTQSFADVRAFASHVVAAGGKLPTSLQNLINSHEVLASSVPPAMSANAKIIDAALDGTLTEARLAELLPSAAAAAQTVEYRKQLALDAERVLLGTWHRVLNTGGADQILDSMRKSFDAHAKEIAKARSLFTADSDPEHVLASGEPGTIEAWGGLQDHITAVGRITLVAREFGAKPTAQFSQVVQSVSADNTRISDEALMCCDGSLVQDSYWFLRPDGPHRKSALFRAAPLKLQDVESARLKYNEWAADEWDALQGARPVEHQIIDRRAVPLPRPRNPYREQVTT